MLCGESSGDFTGSAGSASVLDTEVVFVSADELSCCGGRLARG